MDLGDGDFVMRVLSEADECLDRGYELKRLGVDLDKLEERVLEIYRIERADLYSKSRQKTRSEARSVFWYWTVRELGVEGARMAKRLGMSPPGVAYAIKRGEGVVREKVLRLIE